MIGAVEVTVTCGIGLAATLSTSLAVLAQDADRTIVERLIAAENPCSQVRGKVLGVTIGIDQLEDVTLGTASIDLAGDDLSVALTGRLGCKTSDAAAFIGSASAAVSARASLSLATCDVESYSVTLSEFEGRFGDILGALAEPIEQEIVSATRPRLVSACTKFRDGAP